jgi:hypothetical protein
MNVWWLVALNLSVLILVGSVIRSAANRRRARDLSPAKPDAPEHREARQRSSAPAAPGAAAPAPPPLAAPRVVAPNWNAIGAITGVLGLIVSVIGLFKG